ncbi:olfactory receptor 1-like [Aquarana catesbeiana]|uniref:olfactory receptor 1-like n=1 Tax=Aquarana catesbeiana TaxID=8400 RepID=UPI003CCA0CFD
MENQTSAKEFHILPFAIVSEFTSVVTVIFFFIYLFGVFINVVIIMLIYASNHLHTPMYLFLCNLSILDICYTTVTVPKFLHMCISRNNIISYSQCFMQMYFYMLAGSTENILILTMAFDRYVAICYPLHYNIILNKKYCTLLTVNIWFVGSFNSFIITFQASKMTFCQSKTIHQFFCDGKALMNIACAGLNHFYAVIYSEIFIFGFCTFFCILVSYVKIIKVILQIKSKEGCKKAFSTCSSHLTVIIIYYTTGVFAYMIPKYFNILEQVCTVLYTVVTPMINPLIYSLRNDDVKKALKSMLKPTKELMLNNK